MKAGADAFADSHHDEEDPDACKLILYYIVKGSMPDIEFLTPEANTEYQELLTVAWCLCHKHAMPKLQNLLMAQLLVLIQEVYTELDDISAAFKKTPAGSSLRKLMAEQLMCRICMGGLEEWQVLENVSGIEGAMVEIADASGAYHRDNAVWNDRAGEQKKQAYMVEE
ncbi:hypothetical protein CLAFUW4_12313 [Fulvia fulva]|uniref:Uncharacterized protein n=1 Tax=Passalora fulva TaxID=5499 RepID=A0A9Q8PEF7_PASFU|nr:uncharacterized protein CLAFUR5_11343 [Fulvia fulva]KAK4617878.1 hypothetical protein CLAFUR4_12318 [Fulvia fulva]KAK4618426.1 hypothetical protein CLAFUR0_12329 [Fulvia fulva]UJO21006.1 hypothetical protein CLAFUR5_11343 [Fulvia fulva]WPV17822.1 hypothetical protein CLAFUW4_12313 [Fulvia fulva]WPV33648.1 hypothetical protein CLAFUW7_12320 [Fulvia fulva]